MADIKADLASMEAIMSHWIEYNAQNRIRQRLGSDGNTNIITPPTWPTHTQVLKWVQTLQAARAAIPDKPA